MVEELLNYKQNVKVIVRLPEKLPDTIKNQEGLSMISASVLDLSDKEMADQVAGCNAVASCLDHNLTFKGIYGKPRKLVTEVTQRLCMAVKANKSEKSTKLVLMNTVANCNLNLSGKWSRIPG